MNPYPSGQSSELLSLTIPSRISNLLLILSQYRHSCIQADNNLYVHRVASGYPPNSVLPGQSLASNPSITFLRCPPCRLSPLKTSEDCILFLGVYWYFVDDRFAAIVGWRSLTAPNAAPSLCRDRLGKSRLAQQTSYAFSTASTTPIATACHELLHLKGYSYIKVPITTYTPWWGIRTACPG